MASTQKKRQAAGRKGGKARAANNPPEVLAEISRTGGAKTLELYGVKHMTKIGKKGGKGRMDSMTAQQRTALAKKAVKAREKKRRKRK